MYLENYAKRSENVLALNHMARCLAQELRPMNTKTFIMDVNGPEVELFLNQEQNNLREVGYKNLHIHLASQFALQMRF